MLNLSHPPSLEGVLLVVQYHRRRHASLHAGHATRSLLTRIGVHLPVAASLGGFALVCRSHRRRRATPTSPPPVPPSRTPILPPPSLVALADPAPAPSSKGGNLVVAGPAVALLGFGCAMMWLCWVWLCLGCGCARVWLCSVVAVPGRGSSTVTGWELVSASWRPGPDPSSPVGQEVGTTVSATVSERHRGARRRGALELSSRSGSGSKRFRKARKLAAATGDVWRAAC